MRSRKTVPWFLPLGLCLLVAFPLGCGSKPTSPAVRYEPAEEQQNEGEEEHREKRGEKRNEEGEKDGQSGNKGKESPPVAVEAATPGAKQSGEGAEAKGTEASATAVAAAEQPKRTSQSPIDQLAEGKLYRAALRDYDRGDLKSVAKARDHLLQHPVYNPLGAVLKAMLQIKSGDAQGAMKIAEQLSAIPMMQTESFMVAAEVFRSQGQWNDALRCLGNAVQRNPGHARAHRWMGIIYYDTGAMQRATEHLRAAADIDVHDVGVLRLSGLIHHDYQAFESAVEDYRRALKRKPPLKLETEIRVELSDSLRELRKFDEALEALQPREALNTKATDGAAVEAMRATCWEAKGELDNALTSANAAIELEPNNTRAHLVKGRVLMGKREFAAALPSLELAVKNKPNAHEARFLLGRCLIQTGDPDRGKQEIAKSTEQKELFLKVSELHLKAVEEPGNVEVRKELAQATEQLGELKSAIGWRRAVLGLNPGDKESQAALKRLTSQ